MILDILDISNMFIKKPRKTADDIFVPSIVRVIFQSQDIYSDMRKFM